MSVVKPWHQTWFASCKPQRTTYADGGFITMNPMGRSDCVPLPWPGIGPALDWRRKTDAPTKPKPPLALLQSTQTLNLETNPIASDRQSLAPDLSRPQSLGGAPSQELSLSTSSDAKTRLDQAPFLTMENRFKLVTASDATDAERLGEGLSELLEQSVIHSFGQLNVNGSACFCVTFY